MSFARAPLKIFRYEQFVSMPPELSSAPSLAFDADADVVFVVVVERLRWMKVAANLIKNF